MYRLIFHFALLVAISLQSICFGSAKTILVVLPSSGGFSSMSLSIKGGIEIAKLVYADQLKGLQFIEVDTKDQLKAMTDQVLDSIKLYKPVAMIGGVSSRQALALSEIAESKSIPYIAPYATSPLVTQNKKFTFGICFDDDQQAQGLARFALKKKLKKAVIFYDPNEVYSKGMFDAFSKAYLESGGVILRSFSTNHEKELTEEVTSGLKKLSPDVILVLEYQVVAARIISNISSIMSPTPPFLGPDSWAGGNLFINALSTDLNQKVQAFYVDHWSRLPKNPVTKRYFEIIQSKPTFLTLPPDSYLKAGTALGYDSAAITINAMSTPGTKSNLEKLKQSKIHGITGTIHFGNENRPKKSLYVFRVDGEKDRFQEESE